MSIQTEIQRLKTNVDSSFAAVVEKGGAVPENQNSNNLADAIRGIPAGTLTPGDGITIEGEMISVSFPSKALTLAEYNALSEEQKQSETVYIITDDNG